MTKPIGKLKFSGKRKVRRSAPATKTAPIKALASKTRLGDRIMRLANWGAAKATNAIGPATAVALAVKTIAAIIAIRRVR